MCEPRAVGSVTCLSGDGCSQTRWFWEPTDEGQWGNPGEGGFESAGRWPQGQDMGWEVPCG